MSDDERCYDLISCFGDGFKVTPHVQIPPLSDCGWKYDTNRQVVCLGNHDATGKQLEKGIFIMRDAIKSSGGVMNGTVEWQGMITGDPPMIEDVFGKIVIVSNAISIYRGERKFVLVSHETSTETK